MPDRNPSTDLNDNQHLRLNTLIRLRWLAVIGQLAAILLVYFVFEFPLPLAWCMAVIAMSAWLNLFLRIQSPSSVNLRSHQAALMLGYDIIQLAALLFLTGGLTNPFAFLLLAPVMVSATALPDHTTYMLGALVIAISTCLAVFHYPLPWMAGEPPGLPLLYVAGVWAALVLTVIFMSVYALRVSREGRELADALAATELVLAREQHLSALDGLAAAAAHELGTPLGTIAIVARELEREAGKGSPLLEDLKLLRGQSERCREILGKLTSLSSISEDHLAFMSFNQLIEEVIAPHREFGIEISLDILKGRGPTIERNPGILYGLGNIFENAIDYANEKVEVVAAWSDQEIKVAIADDGKGFSQTIIERIGEPYVTVRSGAGEEDMTGGGLGLGLFIAKTLLERSGATIDFANRAPPKKGAIVTTMWPRTVMEAPIPTRDID